MYSLSQLFTVSSQTETQTLTQNIPRVMFLSAPHKTLSTDYVADISAVHKSRQPIRAEIISDSVSAPIQAGKFTSDSFIP